MNSKFCENCEYKPEFYRLHYNVSTNEAYITGGQKEDFTYCFPKYCKYNFKKHDFCYGRNLFYIEDEWWQDLELDKLCPFYDKYLIEELNNEF